MPSGGHRHGTSGVSLIPGFEAEENIVLNREPKKGNLLSEIFGDRLDSLDRKAMDETAEKAIEKLGVSIDRHMVISSMPVGHKQFTEIARELSKDQLRLLILDEPTAVLTEREAEALLDSIRGMSARGISVIFITHRLQEILSVWPLLRHKRWCPGGESTCRPD